MRDPRPTYPWFQALSTRHAGDIGLAPLTMLAVRRSRSGGWRVVTLEKQMVLSTEQARRCLRTVRDAARKPVLADQSACEATFQRHIGYGRRKTARPS